MKTSTNTKTRSAKAKPSQRLTRTHRAVRKTIALALVGMGQILNGHRKRDATTDRQRAGVILYDLANQCGCARPYVNSATTRALRDKIGYDNDDMLNAIGQAHRDYLRAAAIAGVSIEQDRSFRNTLADRLDEARAMLAQYAITELEKYAAWRAAHPEGEDEAEPDKLTPAKCDALEGYTIEIADRITDSDGKACAYGIDEDDKVIRMSRASGFSVGQIIEAAAKWLDERHRDDEDDDDAFA